MEIREVIDEDLKPLLKLYTQLKNEAMPRFDKQLKNIWNDILAEKNHHLIVGLVDNSIMASCVLIIVPNLTHRQRPYALIENVITHEKFRKRGYATQILNYARQIAVTENCYKIMLLTGSKKDPTLNFYQQAGYNANDKTAFIQWL